MTTTTMTSLTKLNFASAANAYNNHLIIVLSSNCILKVRHRKQGSEVWRYWHIYQCNLPGLIIAKITTISASTALNETQFRLGSKYIFLSTFSERKKVQKHI